MTQPRRLEESPLGDRKFRLILIKGHEKSKFFFGHMGLQVYNVMVGATVAVSPFLGGRKPMLRMVIGRMLESGRM